MRRSEIIEGVNQIIEAIDESNIMESLSGVLTREKSRDAVNLAMQSIKHYFAKSQKFNAPARQLTEILNLEDIENTQFWVFLTISNEPIRIHKVYSSINFARNYLPAVVNLLNTHLTQRGELDLIP